MRSGIGTAQPAIGRPLNIGVSHFPYEDNSGNLRCGGLVHAEAFGDERTGWEVLYRCDKCGAFH